MVVGAFLGTGLSTASRLVTEQQAKHKDRIHLSYQVMKEWGGLREERNSAYELFVVPYGSAPMPPFSSYQALDREHMNKVMEFFDRLDLLNQQHLVNEELVVGYLSQDYQQWEQDYFSKQRGGLETNPIFAYGFQGPYQWLLKS